MRNGVAESDESRKNGMSIPLLKHITPEYPAINDKTIFVVVLNLPQ